MSVSVSGRLIGVGWLFPGARLNHKPRRYSRRMINTRPQSPSSSASLGKKIWGSSGCLNNMEDCIPIVKLHAGAVKPHVHAEIFKVPLAIHFAWPFLVRCGNIPGDAGSARRSFWMKTMSRGGSWLACGERQHEQWKGKVCEPPPLERGAKKKKRLIPGPPPKPPLIKVESIFLGYGISNKVSLSAVMNVREGENRGRGGRERERDH